MRELAKFEEYYGKSSKFLLKAHALFLSKTKLPLFQPSDIENRRCLFCAGGVESCSKLEGFGIQFRNQRY